MDGYAVIIRADITPGLTDRQLAIVHKEAGDTVSYDRQKGTLRFTVSTPDPDADAVQVLTYGTETVTRAVRIAGATASIREGRVLAWEDFEAETFRSGGLAGVAEVTEILGVSRARVYQLMRDHPDFPEPLEDLKGGPVWDRGQVEAWEGGWERKRTGRPRKDG